MTPTPPTVELPDLGAPSGDLEFLLGVLFNQQIRAETAWLAPGQLSKRLGGLDVHELAAAAPGSLAVVMRQPSAIHPFVTVMSQRAIGICGLLVDDYGARAANVWADRPLVATLLRRLTTFPGIGHHEAAVAIAFLTGEYGVPVTGPADEVTGAITRDGAGSLRTLVDYIDITVDGPRRQHDRIRGNYDMVIRGLRRVVEEDIPLS